MLVTFTCDANENITLFGSVALQLLHLMGNSGAVPGAILADDVPDALARLQHALAHMAQQPHQAPNDEDEPVVSLGNRAHPLIALLQNASMHHCNVMWDKG